MIFKGTLKQKFRDPSKWKVGDEFFTVDHLQNRGVVKSLQRYRREGRTVEAKLNEHRRLLSVRIINGTFR